jgi:hypothetical protein
MKYNISDIVLSIGISILFIPWIYYRMGGWPIIICLLLWLVINWGKRAWLILSNRQNTSILIIIIMWIVYTGMRQYIFVSRVNEFPMFSFTMVIWSYVFWLLAEYFIVTKQYIRLMRVVEFILFGIFVSAVIQAYGLFQNYEYSRLILQKERFTTPQNLVQEAMKLGIGGFDFMYALILLSVPVLYTGYNISGNQRKYLLWLGFALLMVSFLATYTIGLLAILLAFIVWFVIKSNMKHPGYVITFILSVWLIVERGVLNIVSILFDFAKYSLGLNEEYLIKLNAIQYMLMDAQPGGTTRFDLYSESIEGFIDNPVFGDVTGKCGEHSLIFDSLAKFGIVGTILWVSIIVLFIQQLNKSIVKSNSKAKGIIYVFIIPWIFTMFLNPIMGRMVYSVLFLIIPGLIIIILNSNTNTMDIENVKAEISERG